MRPNPKSNRAKLPPTEPPVVCQRLPISFPAPAQLEPCVIRHHQFRYWSQPELSTRRDSGYLARVRRIFFSFTLIALGVFNATAQTSNSASILLEAAGQVEFFGGAKTNWQPAVVGTLLHPGDRLRTHAQSRAAVQLSDRSVIRLNERTTLEILPPRRAEKKRFGLPSGSLYFFNREKPADVEFDTPLAAGAIRGTEFLLEVADADSAVHLALIDGLVGLQTQAGEISLQRGEELRLARGQPPQKTALVNARAKIQWALYYPAIVNPAELQLTATGASSLAEVLRDYNAGDLLAALAKWPENKTPSSPGAKILHAQLELAVGQVTEAEQALANLDEPAAVALRQLIAVVRNDTAERRSPTRLDARSETGRVGDRRSASELLAHSYALQACADLEGARAAAGRAVLAAPEFGFAHARWAELEFSFGHRRAAMAELDRALKISPRLAAAHALKGFVLLDQGAGKSALASFEQARDLDAALGTAWLGRGLCLLHTRDFSAAHAAFQTAAALEPQRSLFRSYLGKAAGELGDNKAADKELRLAKELDASDPTAWLYSALQLWQENKLNAAIRDLEKSSELNDNRAVFRSRLLLDDDRAVRSANLAALYNEAGITEASRRTAARSVAESYANFSGHLFLADSYQLQSAENNYDLRLETARQSELLIANLLAPPGAGNLSQVLSQSDRLRFFEQKPIGVSSLTTYGSRGDWTQTGTVFGAVDGFSYALDAAYASLHGQRVNNGLEQRDFILTMKQRVTPDDEAYFQIGDFHTAAGDVANLYDPASAKIGFRVEEKQEPDVYAGWHHTWSPGSHTLLLVARLSDRLGFHDPNESVLFLQTSLFGGDVLAIREGPLAPAPTGQGPMQLDFARDFTLYSAELQHIWETPRFTFVLGGRVQSGDITTSANLTNSFLGLPNPVLSQTSKGTLDRENVYAYTTWNIFDSLQFIVGGAYDRVRFPDNQDLPPLSAGKTTRDLFSPKLGLLYQPWNRGQLRASYTKSLGGLYFDNSVRLEPSQVGGFNQAFRSLIPESVAGLVAGSEFETIGAGFDQALGRGSFFGVELEQLSSHGDREVGTFQSFAELYAPETANHTRETLDFREQNLSAYFGQLLGENFSVGARYRVSAAKLQEHFPQIPATAAGLGQVSRNERALLHQVSLTGNLHLPGGFFAQWESAWYRQDTDGASPALAAADFWQHNLTAGYRFPHRRAELQVGLLNLFDTDYRLNPLNLHADLARRRTFVASLRLNF